MTSWVRLWHDMPTDPKFRTIARAAKQPLPAVIAVFTLMLTDASANETERGRTTATDEDIASAFDLDEDAVSAIRAAMQGRVLSGEMLSGWESRQPKKEDDSAARAKAWRESQKAKNASERDRTISNAEERPDAEAEADTEEKQKPAVSSKKAVRWEIGQKVPADWLDRIRARFPKVEPFRLQSQIRQFEDYWPGQIGKGASKTDWETALVMWVRKAFPDLEADTSQASPDLVVLGPEDALFEVIQRMRGKPINVGNSGKATFTRAEVDAAQAEIGAAA